MTPSTTPASSSSTTTPCTAPKIDYTNEVRFAVVMYGGVSLAIYINGIAQELLSMVRSTAEAYEESGNRVTLSGLKITGPNDPDEKKKLRGTERVYRKLSYLLSDGELLKRYRKSLAAQDADKDKGSSQDLLDDYMVCAGPDSDPQPITMRFIVDILSGTSAGGINAIYLAKALANDQSIDRLKQLWVEEGDIGVLINDKKSVMGLHLRNQEPPQSLLNSRRMYLELLKALDEMDSGEGAGAGFNSPYVDELDLFVTTTDIQGLPLPIRLSDMLVWERRHRNVFRFRYSKAALFGEECNDFAAKNNPFLAFAARCTSSFPFAFEPMRLCDMDEVLNTFSGYRGNAAAHSKNNEWGRFFTAYVDPETGTRITDFATRAFGDGGYLDNKPFSYATETLTRRTAPVPVDRKLIYIEPSPDHPEDNREDNDQPDAITNAKAALIDLPTYETIREDLQRVTQRNSLIKRANRIIGGIEKDIEEYRLKTQQRFPRPDVKPGEWKKFDLVQMANKFGIYYLPYHRLRVAAATDALATLIAVMNNFDEDSDQFFALRCLVRAWRERNYLDYETGAADVGASDALDNKNISQTINAFLIDYDFRYYLRRLNFVRSNLGELNRLYWIPTEKLKPVMKGDKSGEVNFSELTRDQFTVQRLMNLPYDPKHFDYLNLGTEQKEELREFLHYIRCGLNAIYRKLLSGDPGFLISHAAPNTPAEQHDEFSQTIRELFSSELDGEERAKRATPVGLQVINYILGVAPKPDWKLEPTGEKHALRPGFSRFDEEKSVGRAADLLNDPIFSERFQKTANLLKSRLKSLTEELHEDCKKLLRPHTPVGEEPLPPYTTDSCPQPVPKHLTSDQIKSIKQHLWLYYSRFDDYDQISFPILYDTSVGEAAIVDIFRISPEDAPSLIKERGPDADGRRKLAGTALFHFGAFLDRAWRENDIMWGRLDGTERLITALLPNPEHKDVRDKLISEAHGEILIEEMPPKTQQELSGLFAAALMQVSSGEPFDKAIKKVVSSLKDDPVKSRLEKAMRACFANDELLTFVRQAYEVNRQLEPKPLLRSVARATQVIGKIFDDIAKRHKVENKAVLWIARAGQIFWGLVEVAVPGSIANLLMFHWLKLLYVLEILLIAGTFVLGGLEVKRFAWTAFGLTLTVNLAVLLLRDYMRGKKIWLRVIIGAFGLGLVFFVAIGASEIFRPGLKDWLFSLAGSVRAWLLKLFN